MKKLITLLFTAAGLMLATLASAQHIIVKTPEYPSEPTAKTKADSTRELETCLACNGSGKDIENGTCEICQGCGQLVACRIKSMFGYKLLNKIKLKEKIENDRLKPVKINVAPKNRLKHFKEYFAVVDEEGIIFSLRAETTVKTRREADALFLKYKKEYEQKKFKIIEGIDQTTPSNRYPLMTIFDETRLIYMVVTNINSESVSIAFIYSLNSMGSIIHNRLKKERLEKAASKL